MAPTSVPASAAFLGADFDPFTVEVIKDPQMMRDWRTFSSTDPAFGEPGQRNILLNEDPPEQQRARSVISKGLSNSVLRRMRDAFEQEADHLVRELLDGPGIIDGHQDLAKAYLLKVFPDALGLGEANRPWP